MGTGLHLAVALEGTGWHPVTPPDDARFTPGYWVDLVREAERGLLDFVTFEDDLGPVGRLDSVLVASRVAPLTSHIGLIPTAVSSFTEPFHLSKAIATLDYLSTGRAGVRVRGSWSNEHARHFGRRTFPETPDGVLPDAAVQDDLVDETADYVEVLRRLWDSWEDDAEIRDVATGRFIDRDKLHYIDFAGNWFSVKGPSITPRPPQGQPPVAVLSHASRIHGLARRSADLVFTTPHSVDDVRSIGAEVQGLHHFADVVVFLGADGKARVEAFEGLWSDALVFGGTAAELADFLLEWHEAGVSGFRLRPAALPDDLVAVTSELVPELQRRGVFRTAYEASTLRGHLGLPRPANRYAA
ncbi:alkanesulfonate monooxygenase SsuD/methylene tetrahydromethanopterin reductase-like flavin-dependent oxidoreductase (luciferase family) [Saccharothrix tamanrassetensis]|uniref:Alkanesulfonate monooxygenase SsuD/methylene tetrahydromethanopterin reductase-like flavin-dependent oxidoreductase (Luciferase family) n=1 Tax=Saccharothrix tamanrassetensis TaxID=1051531 RepID=A0A841CWF3_9PSEU|nr:LLM class flavin-dependent oxidoreductase [Saccharothrix tamanrassetensis]MBB5960337.1 alkanesulfonate monooxygenase SsuD/methylene tetrahydromethanopterin reductase-like flavin-dependent oxidoreductase (luciferase family) [Saccharothrix tamanrassetensis]